jgi:hypothetical protein
MLHVGFRVPEHCSLILNLLIPNELDMPTERRCLKGRKAVVFRKMHQKASRK